MDWLLITVAIGLAVVIYLRSTLTNEDEYIRLQRCHCRNEWTIDDGQELWRLGPKAVLGHSKTENVAG